MAWEKGNIVNSNGEQKKAILPLIVSASRSTDIPAFYSDWFVKRLKEGYCVWVNPFNQKAGYVSFQKTEVIVFWSKNPRPIMKHLPFIDATGIKYYFQFTVNDYEAEGLEPKVPPLEERIETFKELSDMIGREKVIWRSDPLILTGKADIDALMAKVERIGEKIAPYTERLVFSFADILSYSKVQNSLRRNRISAREFESEEQKRISEKIASLCVRWNIKPATCAEAIDLSEFGNERNRCIDDALILRLLPQYRSIEEFFEKKDYETQKLFDDAAPAEDAVKRRGRKDNVYKDKGQRKECGCIRSKDIGQYNTCPHLCVYCYANTSEKAVNGNRERYDVGNESII